MGGIEEARRSAAEEEVGVATVRDPEELGRLLLSCNFPLSEMGADGR